MERRTFRPGRGWTGGTVTTLLVVAALLVLIASTSWSAPGAPTSALALAPASAPADVGTRANGNFTIYMSEPVVPAVPGAYVRAQFTVTVVTAPANATPLEIWVPQTLVIFYGSNTSLPIFHNPLTFLVPPGGSNVSNMTNLTAVLTFSGEFNQTEPAFLSSQVTALMVNRPYDSVTLSVRARWLLANPDGSVVTGSWSRATLLQPASFAQLASDGPTTVAPGGSFSVCLTGPIAGRTFSLHLATAKPSDDFTQVNQTAPSNAVAPLCWSATVPAWVQPQGIFAHIWDYDRVTLLLYIIKVTVANVTSPWVTLLEPLLSVGGAVTLTALLIACIVAGVGLVRWHHRRTGSVPKTQGGSK